MQDPDNQTNQERTTFNDQADGKFDKAIERMKKATQRSDTSPDQDAHVYSENLMKSPEAQTRATEDASLQDKTYSFDEDNTSNEDFHDIDDDFDEGGDLADRFDTNDNNIH